jgi:hypothetical protein
LKSKGEADSAEKIKKLEAQIELELVKSNAKMMMVSEQLLDEAHGVFMEVWQKLEPRMESVSTTAFKEAQSQILASYSAETGAPLEKPTEYRKRTDGLRVKPAILRDDNCRPTTLDLQLVDSSGEKKDTFAWMAYSRGGKFKLFFKASNIPEGLGQRLGTLSKEVTCQGKYNKNRHLSFLECEHLGQEGIESGRSEKILVEFPTFRFDLDATKDVVVAKEHRYLDLINPDTETPVKEIRVSVNLDKIHIRQFKGPPATDADNVLGQMPIEEKLPKTTAPSSPAAPVPPPAADAIAGEAKVQAPAAPEPESSATYRGRGDEPSVVTTPVK